MSMLPEYPSDPIAYLVRRRFGDAELTGPISGLQEAEEKTQAQLYRDLEAYRTELKGLKEDQLFAQAYQERMKEAQELRESEERTPFYNRADAQADFAYWTRFPLWTLDEATALTLGKDPRAVTWPKVEEYTETSPFAACFDSLRRFVLRSKVAKRLSELVSPADYIAWAQANAVTLPAELEESVQAVSGKVPDWKALYGETRLQLASTRDALERQKPLSEKEKNTFYKMFLGLAAAIYGYNPKLARSPTAKEIADELARVGISIDEDTVRDKLQKSAQEFGHLLDQCDKH